VNELKGDKLLNFESVQNWINSLDQMAKDRGKKGLTKNAKAMRLGRMWEYTNEGKLNPDKLLKEAQEDIDKAGERLRFYFAQKKLKTSHNTAVTSVGYIRGFYVHNGVAFPKRISTPKRKVSKVAKQDEKNSFYKYNSKTDEIEFKNGNLQQFIHNLNFRDQTIALCLLSSGADATDLLKLNVGFAKDGRGKIADLKRFFWHGNRAKTGQPFKTFFSEEATEFLKRYVEQERAEAKDDEPLFPKTNDEPLDAHVLSMNFREAAKKMGYTQKDKASPFRPKRFRHLFRTACAIAHIDPGYTKAMMGHASDVSASYLEQDSSIFEKMYVRAEPFLTVFRNGEYETKETLKEVKQLRHDLSEMTQKNLKLEAKTKEMDIKIEDLNEQLKEATEMVYSFEPLLDLLGKVADIPEGQKLINKIQNKRMQEINKVKEKFRKDVTKDTKES
jgi:integrase